MFSDAELESHRAALRGHCYRMLGSAVDADDAVQATMIRAWKARDQFQGTGSVGSWLYRIATRVCFDALAESKRRMVPYENPAAVAGETISWRNRCERWRRQRERRGGQAPP